jgi:quinol monooxygenase YgiN
MSEIRVSAALDVHAGKLEEFRTVATAVIQVVREKDSGTRKYDWYHNADHSRYLVLEHYRDSEAVLEHIENLGELFGALLETCDLTLDVFGNPSAELAEAAAAIPTRVYTFYQGL